MLPMNYSSPVSLVAGCGPLIDQIDFLQLVERFPLSRNLLEAICDRGTYV
jgi:hypothetical protein